MRTSFHHQPEAQHPNFQLSTSWQADYPIFWGQSGRATKAALKSESDPKRTSAALANGQQVVKSFRYLLTDPRQFDMLYPSPGPWGIECNSIN